MVCRARVLLAAMLPLVLVACEPAGSGDPIARIGKTTITVESLQKQLDEQSPFVRVRYAEPDKKREFLDAQVRFEVLAQEARARGYDQDPEVQDAIKKIIVQRLTREEFDSRVKLADITDAELQKYYDDHKADFQKPEMVRASILVVSFGADDNTKIEAKKKIEALQQQASAKDKLEDRVFFRELVEKNTTDETTKAAGGDLRYLSQPELEQRFGRAAADWLFTSDANNEVSPVIEGDTAFFVFKRMGRRNEVTRGFEQVKNQIKNVVYRDRRSAAFDSYVEELKKKAGVTVYPEKLDKIRVEATVPQDVDADPHGHAHGPPGMPEQPSDGPADVPPPAPAPPVPPVASPDASAAAGKG